MANAFDKARAQLSGGGELTLEAMDEYQLLEAGRKVYDFCKGLMRDPVLRQIIRQEAARVAAEEMAQYL